ncbi:MAG: OmpA family protein [Kiritimatiellae bacterium]|jgi:peptidoglycan-associated lipoprotein|nr:OmpA family protein [Kiritimatiellia bacterium]
MKFSMMVAVLAAVFCVAGCKYQKAGSGSGLGNGAEGSDIITDADAEVGSLSDATEPKFDDLYAKCTDVEFAPVYFGFDSTVVPQGELSKVDAVAEHLKDRTERVVIVEGNCDERGSNEYNLSLGENRAIVVRNYLVNNGIDASRIQVRSYGEEKPATEGSDESAWSLNRRDEFGIYDTTQKK